MFKFNSSQIFLLKTNFKTRNFDFIANSLDFALAGKFLTVNNNHYLNKVIKHIGFNGRPYFNQTNPNFIIATYPSNKILNEKIALELFINIIPSDNVNDTLYGVVKANIKHY